MAGNSSTKKKIKLRAVRGVQTQEANQRQHRAAVKAGQQLVGVVDVDQESHPIFAKDRYSIMMDPTLARKMRMLGREMGLSFNAVVTLACFYFTANQSNPPAIRPSASQPLPDRPSSPGVVVVNQKSADGPLQKKLEKFGPMFVGVAEGGEPRPTISWDQLEKYVQLHRQHPTLQWHELGKMMNLTMEEARAADQGEDSHKFEQYMTVKYGPPTARNTQKNQKGPNA